MNRRVSLYEKTGSCGIALIVLAQVSLYLFIKNSLYLRWVYRDFKLFFRRVESGKIPVSSGKAPTTKPRTSCPDTLDILATPPRHSCRPPWTFRPPTHDIFVPYP